MEKLTDKQAIILQAINITDLSGVDLTEVLPSRFWDEDSEFQDGLAEFELAQYDADQAAKRAVEIEAAYKEGLLDGISLTDSMTEDEYIESVTNAWAASDTKKSLEAK